MITINFKPISAVEFTIQQKASNTHIKFMIVKGQENPFPVENYFLARGWMEQGLLDGGAFRVMKQLSQSNGRVDEMSFTFET